MVVDVDVLSKMVSSNRLVCGTDGVTYKNDCHLKRSFCSSGKCVGMAHTGSCHDITHECYTQCPKEKNPVCGSDDKTTKYRIPNLKLGKNRKPKMKMANRMSVSSCS